MTLRIPNDIRSSLDNLVQQGTSDSVTSAIIERLRKSLIVDPVDHNSSLNLIKQKSTEIQELIMSLEPTQEYIENREQALQQLMPREQRLLSVFGQLNDLQQNALLESLLPLIASFSIQLNNESMDQQPEVNSET